MLIETANGDTALDPRDFARHGRDIAPLAFLAAARTLGLRGALVSISAIHGGAPKALGTHMAVLEDGRHLGHISGGCVEPAIAAEVAATIAAGQDQILRFGNGSRFIDIRFPCGGGVDLLVHINPATDLLDIALSCAARRQPFSLAFTPKTNTAAVIEDDETPTGWIGANFFRRHLPRTRLLLVGRGPELEIMARVGSASEAEIAIASPDLSTASALSDLDVPVELLKTPSHVWDMSIDRWTATVLLFHEHEWEDTVLSRAAGQNGFYIGAMGSVRTHRQRCERLAALGVTPDQLARIRGPIGVLDRAREPGVLALSVLAEIVAARMALDQV